MTFRRCVLRDTVEARRRALAATGEKRKTGAVSLANDIAELFRRDLTRLLQELGAFEDDEKLWQSVEGISNSAGNLALHLEGNLREYIGRQLGNVAYSRLRDAEFTSSRIPSGELLRRMRAVRELIPEVISSLSSKELEAAYPEQVFGAPLSTQQFLIHLHGHLNYHLGQIDYLRRILTSGAAVQFAGL